MLSGLVIHLVLARARLRSRSDSQRIRLETEMNIDQVGWSYKGDLLRNGLSRLEGLAVHRYGEVSVAARPARHARHLWSSCPRSDHAVRLGVTRQLIQIHALFSLDPRMH